MSIRPHGDLLNLNIHKTNLNSDESDPIRIFTTQKKQYYTSKDIQIFFQKQWHDTARHIKLLKVMIGFMHLNFSGAFLSISNILKYTVKKVYQSCFECWLRNKKHLNSNTVELVQCTLLQTKLVLGTQIRFVAEAISSLVYVDRFHQAKRSHPDVHKR